MKNLLSLTVLLMACSLYTQAQTADYNNALTLQVGPLASGQWAGEKIHSLTTEEVQKLTSSNYKYSFMINWDVAPWGKLFTLNTGLGFHKMDIIYDSDGSIPGRQAEKLTDHCSSWTWGTRGLFHFLNKEGSKIDLYAGLGIYVTLWTMEREGNPNYIYKNSPFIQGGAPLILGGRFYFADQWAITGEVSTYPNFPLSIGITRGFSLFD